MHHNICILIYIYICIILLTFKSYQFTWHENLHVTALLTNFARSLAPQAFQSPTMCLLQGFARGETHWFQSESSYCQYRSWPFGKYHQKFVSYRKMTWEMTTPLAWWLLWWLWWWGKLHRNSARHFRKWGAKVATSETCSRHARSFVRCDLASHAFTCTNVNVYKYNIYILYIYIYTYTYRRLSMTRCKIAKKPDRIHQNGQIFQGVKTSPTCTSGCDRGRWCRWWHLVLGFQCLLDRTDCKCHVISAIFCWKLEFKDC